MGGGGQGGGAPSVFRGVGDRRKQPLRVQSDGKLRLEFHEARITSDAGARLGLRGNVAEAPLGGVNAVGFKGSATMKDAFQRNLLCAMAIAGLVLVECKRWRRQRGNVGHMQIVDTGTMASRKLADVRGPRLFGECRPRGFAGVAVRSRWMEGKEATVMRRFVRLMSPLVGIALLLAAARAEAQLRVVTWNVTNYSSGRVADFQAAIFGEFEGRSMSPDIMACQEFLSASAVSSFLAILNTAPGGTGDWAAAEFVDGPNTDSAFFYRTTKAEMATDLSPNGVTVVAAGGGCLQSIRRTSCGTTLCWRRAPVPRRGLRSIAAT